MNLGLAHNPAPDKPPAFPPVHDSKLAPLWRTFRNIHAVVFLLLVFAVAQMYALRQVCNQGMSTADSLANQGLPYLGQLGELEQHLALYRLYSYEYPFAHQTDRDKLTKAADRVMEQIHSELDRSASLLRTGQAQQLAENLNAALDDLAREYRMAHGLSDSDMAGAMEVMDNDVPLKLKRVTDAMAALENYGYAVSSTEADATLGGFSWILDNAVMFGSASIVVSLGAVVFVLIAARRTRTQLSVTMTRLEEQSQELAHSVSLLNATLDSTADGIVAIDRQNRVLCHNKQFVKLWGFSDEMLRKKRTEELMTLCAIQTQNPEHFLKLLEASQTNLSAENLYLVDFKDGRVVECFVRPQWLNGQRAGIVLSFRDVTARKQAERALLESQALYQSLVDQLPAGIFRKNREGRYVFVNSWYCRFKGIQADVFLGKTPAEVAQSELARRPVADPAEALETQLARQGGQHHEQIMKTGRQLEVEERYTDPEWGERYLHVVKIPTFGADGTIVGSQGVIFDITQRKKVEVELAYERELLRSLLDSSEELIYFKDKESRFIRCSAALGRRFKMSGADAVVGKTDFDFFAPEHARPALEDEQRIIRTGQPVIAKLEQETWPDGRVTWSLTSKMPLRDVTGEIIGTFGFSKDITAIKEAEAKLVAVHRQLVEASRQAGMAEVATNVLHNVGNVLNSINVSTTLVQEKIRKSKVGNLGRLVALLQEHHHDLAEFIAADARGRQLPDYIARLAEHLTAEQAELLSEMELTRKHIEHIKDIVTMQQSYAKVSGIAEKVKVIDLVEDSLRMNAGALVRHDVQVIRDYPAMLPEIVVEKHKVLQILVNLIRNAKYACDESGRTDKELTLQVRNGNGRVRIVVKDNGVGIPAENMTRIFNHGFTTREKGHGFGLHSGALAAREMGGTLAAFSDGTGSGATFILELPLLAPAANP